MPSASTGHAPDLDKYLKSIKGQAPLEASIESLISLLKRRQIVGSEPCAVATAHILRQVVAKSRWQDVDTLIDNVSRIGRRLVAAQPNEYVIANIVRRVLGLIRDEALEDRTELEGAGAASDALSTPVDTSMAGQQWTDGSDAGLGASKLQRPGPLPTHNSAITSKTLFHLLSASPSNEGEGLVNRSPFATSGASTPSGKPKDSQVHALRSEVIDGIEEIKDEISQVDDQIASSAEVQIHPGDYILVHQPSPTVERFLLRAALKRKFTVFLATQVPSAQNPEAPHAALRKKLSSAGVEIINIMSGALMAYMSRVDKVILGARAIVANGGVVTDSGAAAIARAAKEHGNPVVVLGGVYKLCPVNPFDEASTVEWAGSNQFVSFSDGAIVGGVQVRSAVSELIPPELVDTYITNLGTHSRDHLSSLIADHYKQEDVHFHLWDDAER